MPFLAGSKDLVVSVCGARIKPIKEMVFHGDIHIEVENFDARYLDLLPVLFNIISDAQINSYLLRKLNVRFTNCRPVDPKSLEERLSWFYGPHIPQQIPTTKQQEINLDRPVLELVYLLFRHLFNLLFSVTQTRSRP
ncbi:MAG: hypothetical protein JZD40_07065 [Sulfolobus sp.]|nr:hypothetical protein [Sulfolobus sp.]